MMTQLPVTFHKLAPLTFPQCQATTILTSWHTESQNIHELLISDVSTKTVFLIYSFQWHDWPVHLPMSLLQAVHAGGMFLLRQGCPNYSAWAKCSPPSNFDWPISKTKTIGDCGPQIIFALKVSHFFELARHRTVHMPPQQSPWHSLTPWKRRDQLCCHFPSKDWHGQ